MFYRIKVTVQGGISEEFVAFKEYCDKNAIVMYEKLQPREHSVYSDIELNALFDIDAVPIHLTRAVTYFLGTNWLMSINKFD